MAKIVIIGGGVSGLSAGILAAKEGHAVTICEQHSIAGGNLTGWRRGGYFIDNCIHWLTGTNRNTELYRTWEELGALGEGIEIHQAQSLYTVFRDGEALSLFYDLSGTEEQMLRLSPDDTHEIRRLVRAVRLAMGYFGIGGEMRNQKASLEEWIQAFPILLSLYRMSTGELASRFRHPLLRDLVSQLMGKDFCALAWVMVAAHFCGGNAGIPRGGSRAMAERLTMRFERLGGHLFTSCRATHIRTLNHRATAVELSDGRILPADYVILAGDPIVQYPMLLQKPLPKNLQAYYDKHRGMRFSSIHCALACDTPDVPFQGDFIFLIPSEYHSRMGCTHLILREYSHEPSNAPKGKSILQCMIFCDEEGARAYLELSHDRRAYKQQKKRIAEDVKSLVERQFPSLQGKTYPLDIWTPATYSRYTSSEIGSWMSFILPPKEIPKYPSNRSADFENVIFASQWLHAPGGLPSAALQGERAVRTLQKLCRHEKKLMHMSKTHMPKTV